MKRRQRRPAKWWRDDLDTFILGGGHYLAEDSARLVNVIGGMLRPSPNHRTLCRVAYAAAADDDDDDDDDGDDDDADDAVSARCRTMFLSLHIHRASDWSTGVQFIAQRYCLTT